MATFAVRHQSRALKNGRLRGRHESGEENIRLDFSRAPAENVKEILSNIVCQNAISKNKKLGYLNFFVKLLNKLGPSKNLGYTMEEILCCLKVGLLHEAKEVRAATLRVIRYLLTEQKVLDIIVSLHIDYLIARCLDICLSNEVERIHAMKLIRKIIQLFPHQVPLSMLYPMVAIGRDGSSERDRLRRACLATICELAFVNAQAADRCDAISCILRNILDCYHYPRINESLVVTILFLLNHPNTRHYIKQNTDLEQLIAPFTDCHFKYSAEANEHGTGELEHRRGAFKRLKPSTVDEQETRFKASKMALLTVMRSWPGLIRMCKPTGSGLQSLIGILYIQNNEIRQAIMDVMFDLFRLTTPKLTDNFVEALNSVDPSAMTEEWKLLEGFVAEEGRAILPHLAKVRPNLIENHLALILAAWIETGILQALVEVITSTEGNLFIRAVILLGELLHMANTLLPHECTTHSHCLPNLMAVASSFDIPSQHRHRATLAVSYLNRIHTLKKRGPRPCSLFLDQLIQNANTTLQQESFYTQFSQDRLSSDAVKTVFNADDFVSQVIRETHVLSTKEHKSWDWHSISALLKCPDKFKKLDDQTSQRFVRRLLYFFKPTSGHYCSIEQKHPAARKITVACCHFIDFLIETDVEETNKLIVEFLGDINNSLSEMKSERAIVDSIFSLTLINNTLSKYYFLFIGRFSATDRGEQCLQRAGIFQSICDVISSSTPDIYIKLIVSSMYYARDCSTKVILSKALVSSSESGRLYATKFLRVLLRTKMPMFRTWGTEVLVTQLYDQSRAVAMAALNVIDEACEIQSNLESLIKHRPSVLHLGEKGTMLVCRFLSHQRGFTSLRDTNYIDNELVRWHKSFNMRYVKIVEELLNEALTTYERTYEGSFARRTSKKCPRKDVYLPVHLYGQLTQHKQGFQLLKSQDCIQEYFHCIKYQVLNTDADLILLKSALWAVGHIGMSTYGIVWLKEEGLVTEIIRLAEECGVFSVRGTAFYTLGLLASTRQGANILAQYGWESTWRNRSDKWPIVEHHEPEAPDDDDDDVGGGGGGSGGRSSGGGTALSPETPSDHQNVSLSSGGTRSDSEELSSSMATTNNLHIGLGGMQSSFERCGSSEERDDQLQQQQFKGSAAGAVTAAGGRTYLRGTFKVAGSQSQGGIVGRGGAMGKEGSKGGIRGSGIGNKSSGVGTKDDSDITLHRVGNISRSSTLPPRSSGFDRSQVVAVGRFSTKSKSMHGFVRERSGFLSPVNPPPGPGGSATVAATTGDRDRDRSPTKSFHALLFSSSQSERSSIDKVEEENSDSLSECQETDDPDPGAAADEEEGEEDEQQRQLLHPGANDNDDNNNNNNDDNHNNNNHNEHNHNNNNNNNNNGDGSGSSSSSSVGGGSGVGVGGGWGACRPFEIGGVYRTRVGSLREPPLQHSASDSSRASNKSRADSFNTDSTTSGVSSCDDSGHAPLPPPPLTVSGGGSVGGTCSSDPTVASLALLATPDSSDSSSAAACVSSASTSSAAAFRNQQQQQQQQPHLRHHHHHHHLQHQSALPDSASCGKDYVHPSSQQRKLVNLSRVPSMRRHYGSPPYGIKPCVQLQGLEHVDNQVSYTSTRDAAGLATLRLIRRQRTSSSDVDSDYGLNNLYGEDDAFSRTCSIGSQKSAEAMSFHESKKSGSQSARPPTLKRVQSGRLDSMKDRQQQDEERILRNMSSSSLQDFEVQHSSPYSTMSKNAQTIPRLGSVHPEFVGLCLPVDINMLFEVVEGEDRRSNSMSSTHSPPTDRKSMTKHTDCNKMPKLSITGGCDEPEQHLPQNCLMCCHQQRLDGAASQTVSINITDLDNNISYLDTVLPISSELTGSSQKVLESSSNSPTPTIEPTQTRLIEARSNSHDTSWVTPSSITSNTSTESATKKLTDDSPFGKTKIRKEILKFVVNLSSSVGLKMSEQGLLSLKQKFPKAFQDPCFYSDVCHLLSNYLYGLSARRFIQEIFDELDITKFLERPQMILGIKESDFQPQMEPIQQHSLDSFSDSFI